jgi:hypothetical protein
MEVFSPINLDPPWSHYLDSLFCQRNFARQSWDQHETIGIWRVIWLGHSYIPNMYKCQTNTTISFKNFEFKLCINSLIATISFHPLF